MNKSREGRVYNTSKIALQGTGVRQEDAAKKKGGKEASSPAAQDGSCCIQCKKYCSDPSLKDTWALDCRCGIACMQRRGCNMAPAARKAECRKGKGQYLEAAMPLIMLATRIILVFKHSCGSLHELLFLLESGKSSAKFIHRQSAWQFFPCKRNNQYNCTELDSQVVYQLSTGVTVVSKPRSGGNTSSWNPIIK